MPKISAALLVSIAMLMGTGIAEAQLLGILGGGGRGGEINNFPSAEPVDDFDADICNDIASGPSPMMPLDACRSMMMMQQRMQAASSDPNAVRSGDENLTCAQIHDEIRASGGPVMSQATIAQNQQAGEAALATMEKQRADAKGYVAGQVALGVGAAALGMVPGVGGFATNAANMVMDARQKAFEERQEAATASIMAQSAPAIAATEAEIGEAVRTNPRYARLMQLVVDKACPPPASP